MSLNRYPFSFGVFLLLAITGCQTTDDIPEGDDAAPLSPGLQSNDVEESKVVDAHNDALLGLDLGNLPDWFDRFIRTPRGWIHYFESPPKTSLSEAFRAQGLSDSWIRNLPSKSFYTLSMTRPDQPFWAVFNADGRLNRIATKTFHSGWLRVEMGSDQKPSMKSSPLSASITKSETLHLNQDTVLQALSAPQREAIKQFVEGIRYSIDRPTFYVLANSEVEIQYSYEAIDYDWVGPLSVDRVKGQWRGYEMNYRPSSGK